MLPNLFDEIRGRRAASRSKPALAQQAGSKAPVFEGSPSACAEKWVAGYGDYLFRYALLRLRHRQASEDVVQETFLAALKSYRNFQGRSSEKTWLVNILKHKIVDYLRKASRERAVRDEEFEGWFEDVFEEHGHWNSAAGKFPRDWGASDPERAFQGQQFWKALQASLGELPSRVAEAFVLREIEGLETDEICQALGVTRNNLWVMLHRARMYLRHSLEAGGYGGAQALKPKFQS